MNLRKVICEKWLRTWKSDHMIFRGRLLKNRYLKVEACPVQLRDSTIAIIIPCARPADVAESWPRARLQVLPNSGSQMFMLRVKTLSVRDRHWRNPRRRKNYYYKERSNMKSARVSTLTGSVPLNMAAARQKDSASSWSRTHVSRLSTTSLNHSTIDYLTYQVR